MPDELKEKFDEVNELMAELTDIRKRPMKYGLQNLHDWLDKKLDRVNNLMDEIEYEVNARGTEQVIPRQEVTHEHIIAV